MRSLSPSAVVRNTSIVAASGRKAYVPRPGGRMTSTLSSQGCSGATRATLARPEPGRLFRFLQDDRPPPGHARAMILVTGATGTVGSIVVRLLRERGEPLRAMTRSRDGQGADAVFGD